MKGKRDWTLTPQAFAALLGALDSDAERAAAAYERLHERVTGLLRWWGAHDPQALADETLDRVARRIEEGADIRSGLLGAFVRGVARLVFYESTREPRPVAMPEPVAAEERADDEAAMRCLDDCLETLDRADRDLVLAYYGDDRQISARKKLAARLQVSMTALRIRTCRIRARLEACVMKCFQSAAHP